MKKITLFGALLISLASYSQVTIFTENFEGSAKYSLSTPEFSDGSGDFFTVTDGTNISSSYEINNIEGSKFFAAMDIDGEVSSSMQTMTFEDININGAENLQLIIAIAEDDDGTNEDWDAEGDNFYIEVDIDNSGTFTKILQFENDGSQYNTAPQQDTDYDGIGDGNTLTNTLTDYTATIAGQGNTIDIRLSFNFNSADEDIAIDNIRLTSSSSLSVKDNVISNLQVKSSNGSISTNKGTILNIFNIVGQQVANQNLPTGVYVVAIKENNVTVVEKVYVN